MKGLRSKKKTSAAKPNRKKKLAKKQTTPRKISTRKDPYWTLPTRIAICHQFRLASNRKATRMRRLRSLKPGKQGTVDLEQDQYTKIKVVVKRSELTHSVVDEHKAAKRGHEDDSHPWATQPNIEYRVGRLLSRVLERKFCPNLVFLYEMDIGLGRLSTILESFDHNLFHLIRKRKSVHLTTPLWYSMWFQICAGLISMHRNQTTHSDLHPENILYKKIKAGGYWTYVIGKHHFHVPNLGYVFAVADYGRARSVVNRTQLGWHAKEIQRNKLDLYGLGWASYDYFRLYKALRSTFPLKLTSEFNVLPKKGPYPVEQAVKRIFTKLYAKKPKGQGSQCLGEYHIVRRVTKEPSPKQEDVFVDVIA